MARRTTKSFIMRTFKCPECGEKFTASKGSGHRTPSGHVKMLWCYKCKLFTNMVQCEEGTLVHA